MAASDLKREIRATLTNWKLSVHSQDKKEETFVGNVFQELDGLMEMIFKKHDGSCGNNSQCHRVLDCWPMTRRCIEKLHDCIYRRLRYPPTTASPFFATFSREVPREIFDIILKDIMERNGFGHTVKTTPARVSITITDKRKAVYFFNRINSNGVVTPKAKLLQKEFSDGGFAKVLISQEAPMIMRYSLNSEMLMISFYYGYWNSFDVPQH